MKEEETPHERSCYSLMEKVQKFSAVRETVGRSRKAFLSRPAARQLDVIAYLNCYTLEYYAFVQTVQWPCCLLHHMPDSRQAVSIRSCYWFMLLPISSCWLRSVTVPSIGGADVCSTLSPFSRSSMISSLVQ